jgi:transcriptional regulator with XRE-family HTH domain
MAKNHRRPPGRGNAFSEALGLRIRAARKVGGLTVRGASALTRGHVTDVSWHLYESGKGQPKLSAFLAMAAALGCPLHVLLPEPLAAPCRSGRYAGADLRLIFDPRLLDKRTRKRISAGGTPDGKVNG